MNKLVSILFILFVFSLSGNATTYYVSGSGNDNNNGQSPSSPWQTLGKVSSFKSFVSGDNILFNRGDFFYGTLTVNNSGSSGSPITFGAYGSGNYPVISGFTTVTSWTSLGNNIWESTNSVSSSSYTNVVSVNGVNTPMGRYPNTGFLTYQSANGNTSITSSSLSGGTNWTGAELVSYSSRASFSRAPITAQSGGTLNYTPSAKISAWDQSVPQFFIQNDPRTLDVTNEWYFNPSTKKLRIYSNGTPSGVNLSTVDVLADLNGDNYITFNNLTFQGSNIASIRIVSSRYVSIQNCNISLSGRDAISAPWANSATGLDIENNNISNSNNNAIDLSNICDYAKIRYNTISNTGVIPGMTDLGDNTGFGIDAPGANSLIEYNTIQNCGYTGIKFFGSNTTINNNFINIFCTILRDGGGIYSWNGSPKSVQTGIKILNNIVLNNNTSSALNTENYGIYLDDFSNNIEVNGNTSANCGWGIELHSVYNIKILNNTTYNNSMASIFFMSDNGKYGTESYISGQTNMNNIAMQNNIFFAKTSQQKTLWLYPSILPIVPPNFSADYNYYARPIDNTGKLILSNYQPSSGAQQLTDLNLATWQIFSGGQDIHSNIAPKTITDTNDLRFEYNATSSSKTVSLDAKYIDVKNNTYNGSITLAPFTSVVLTKTGAASNQAPTADAGSNQTIVLPTNTVNLSGSGSDPDGNISSYKWIETSGPSQGSISNASSAATSVTGLAQGVYQFQLTVTDNGGAIATDVVQVTVNNSGGSNIAPNVSAGSDQTINLPTTSLTLGGSASDQDGTISSYSWKQLSGPSNATIVNIGSITTLVTGLSQGTYEFQLSVTDNANAVSSANVIVKVEPLSLAGLLPAVVLNNPVNNITYSYYETSIGYSSVPDFTKLTPVKSGAIDNFDISAANKSTLYSFNFNGYIDVPSDGQYTFYTTSDDGSLLYIDNVLVVNNDGLHGATERSGTIGLKAGKHAISVGYIQQGGGSTLVVNYSGPNISKQAIPASVLYIESADNLLPAVNPSNTVNGLNYSYYESTLGFTAVPNFGSITPVKSGTVNNFDISVANRTYTYSLNFTGYITVPSDGQYTFYTTSDDGSLLYIDNVLVANNDGWHGSTERSGTIGLKAGKHAISVGYIQQGGGSVLNVNYSGPGVTKQAVPASSLFRVSSAGNNLAIDNSLSQAISSNSEIGVKAYPNPFVNYVTVNLKGAAGEYKLMIVDVSGRIMWSANGTKSEGSYQQSINTSALQRGIYFLRVIQNNKSSVIKLEK